MKDKIGQTGHFKSESAKFASSIFTILIGGARTSQSPLVLLKSGLIMKGV